MNRAEQSLLKQMKMSDVEISHRMEFLGLGKAELDILFSHKVLIEGNIDGIIEEFYEKQTAIDEIPLLTGDADTLIPLRSAQRKYVMDLFSGNYDGEYVNNRLRIEGEPKLYLSAVRTLKGLIVKTLKKNIEKGDLLDETINALDKLIYFDSTLVFDTYIDNLVREAENAKKN
jgi:hypothetical protein